jgi:hypothetical protein
MQVILFTEIFKNRYGSEVEKGRGRSGKDNGSSFRNRKDGPESEVFKALSGLCCNRLWKNTIGSFYVF